MDESFSIDYVDIEWGLRAMHAGYSNYGVCDATMAHPIGEQLLTIPFLRKKVPLHSPLRYYYHFRNAVLLYKRSYSSLSWVVNDSARLVAKFVVYALFAPDRLRHIQMMSRGVWHGLIGVSGRLDDY